MTVGIDGSGPDATGGSTSDESDDDEPTQSTHGIPSLEEVGRADFTHTVVAGDFLRSIADTYDVEIDDIVGANEWGVDGRQHLLLPGHEIYLPADAVMPPATTTSTVADAPAAIEFPDAANVVWPAGDDPPVCTDPSGIQGECTVQAGDTEESLITEFGITADELNEENPSGISYEGGERVNVCHTWFE